MELVLAEEVWVSQLHCMSIGKLTHHLSVMWWDRGRSDVSSLLTTFSIQESYPQCHELKRASSTPQQLQHLGVWALYLAWAPQ